MVHISLSPLPEGTSVLGHPCVSVGASQLNPDQFGWKMKAVPPHADEDDE